MRRPVSFWLRTIGAHLNISLTPELEQLVNDKVKSGMYQTASEVIREGLRLLGERDQRVAALRRDVRAGFEAVDRGDFSDYDKSNIKELSARVKARGRKRLADTKLKTHQQHLPKVT